MSLSIEQFRSLAAELRMDVLDMVHGAGTGHVDSSFSVIEVLVTLYFDVLRLDGKRPDWPDRDRVVLSKGHAAPALYACLARRGYFDGSDLRSLRQLGSHLQGHPKVSTPGVDVPTGSLGQGLSLATGMAYAAWLEGRNDARWRVVAVLSDGELNEGQTWEAIMLAGHLGLSNLTMVVDRNGLQYTGPTKEVLAIQGAPAAMEALGWSVRRADGHSYVSLRHELLHEADRPVAILADTVKGKGVSFMEHDLAWHGRAPTDAEYAAAREELVAALNRARGMA